MEKMTDRLNLPLELDIKKILKLDDKKLPSFPQVAAKLLEISKDEAASLKDLSKIVETDPGISIRVLEIVNSAMYGLTRKITALSEAVVFLGADEIKKLALGMTVFEKMFKKGNAKQFDRLLFWRHSLSVAVLSMEIAKETGYANPEEAYITGLLHDIGKIFLDIQGKKDYGAFIQELSASTDLVIEKERSIIGLGHDDIGAFFCNMWKLPEKLVLAVKYHHQPFEHLDLTEEEMLLISIVSLANFLCWTQGIGSFDFIRPPILPPEVEKAIDLKKIDIIKCILNMNQEVENISKFYNFVFPSVAQLKENSLWANLKLSKVNTKYYYQEDPLKQFQGEALSKDTNLPSDLELEFGRPLAKAKSIKEVLDIVMYQVGRIFAPRNWSILLKDPKTDNMIFSVVVGANKKKLQGAKLPKGEGIAGHIMETGESLIIEDVTKDKRFSVRVDKHSGFKTQSIIGTPLKTDDKIFGVIELINKINDDKFTDQDLMVLSSIAEYAAIAIERSYYNQALKNLATKNPVTGIKNKWSFDQAISDKKTVLKTYGSIFSMLMINIDKFGQINKTNGQDVSRKIIKLLAQVLTKTKRREDNIFHHGEDTFIVLLPQTYADGAEQVKDRITDAFDETVSEKYKFPVELNIMTYTVNAKDSGQLKSIVRDSLIKPEVTLNEKSITDLENSLQPLLDQANKKAIDKNKNKQTIGKTVSLKGNFIRLKTGGSGNIRIEQLTMDNIGLRISESHSMRINEFLDIQFTLDNTKKSLVKRRIVVREIKGNFINAEFYNPPPFSKNLGFYLMS
jgi:two-component system cell cycle response regulator